LLASAGAFNDVLNNSLLLPSTFTLDGFSVVNELSSEEGSMMDVGGVKVSNEVKSF
jgi:hypothetical protein